MVGPSLDGPEPADALQAVRDLLRLVRELGRVRDVLEPAAPAAAEVGTRRLDPVRRRRLDRLDDAAAETRTGVDEPNPEPITGNGATNEHDVAVDATDSLATEREVVDAQRQSISSL